MALTVSYLNTPQAVDDTFTISAADLSVQTFDVMANDSGGKAKRLYSLDGGDVPSDLLVRDTAKASELSAKGATIWLTTDGKLAYDPSALADRLGRLAQGEIFEDSFTYAIQLGNGTLSMATATVRIVGVNDAPVANPDTNSAVEGGAIVTGSVATNDSDADNGAVLTYALSAPVAGLTFNFDGSYSFDPSDPAYQELVAGQSLDVEAHYTVTDELGASASSQLTITVTGVSDDVPSGVANDHIITNIAAGSEIVIPGSALLANDTGDALSITGVEAPSGDTVVHSSGNVIFTGQGLEGGSFTYFVDGGSAQVTVERKSGSTLEGTDNGEILIGGSGNDVLDGDAGNDVLIGGAGADRMAGGSGADIFVLGHNGAVDTHDTITDFSKADGDKLDFRDLLSSFGLADHSQAFEQGYLTFLAWGPSGTQINADFNGRATDGQFGGSLGAIAIITNEYLTHLDTASFIL